MSRLTAPRAPVLALQDRRRASAGMEASFVILIWLIWLQTWMHMVTKGSTAFPCSVAEDLFQACVALQPSAGS